MKECIKGADDVPPIDGPIVSYSATESRDMRNLADAGDCSGSGVLHAGVMQSMLSLNGLGGRIPPADFAAP
jgi:hypothetical protein